MPNVGDIAPHPRAAVIEERKLVGYVLSTAHPTGRHKARVFRTVLGIEAANWEYLRDQLIAGLQHTPLTRVSPASPPHVATFGVDIAVRGLNGRTAEVTTAWKLVAGIPWLVSAYITP